MPTIPATFVTKLDSLSRLLAVADRIVFDFESSNVTPRDSAIAGCGVYDPDHHTAAYINLGHAAVDDRFPRYTPEQFVEVLRPFFSAPTNLMIAHNTAFDLRWLIKHGADRINCRVADSLIRFHRIDENMVRYAKAPTRHRKVDISYGLKELTTIFARERPPELFEVTHGQNALFAPIMPTALYCLQDCVNTALIYELAEERLWRDERLHTLVEQIDDLSNVPVARMMWDGIGIDVEEAWRQKDDYERAIQECRNLIWRISGVHLDIETKREVIAFLKRINITTDLGYNPFVMPTWREGEDPSLTTDDLADMFEDLQSEDKRLIVAAFISNMGMQQRINAFCRPLPNKASGERLYLDRFSPTQASTRYSCSPNLQALPKRSDKINAGDPALILPEECRENFKTRNIVRAKPGCVLVSFDLVAAEPRYLAIYCERAITEQDNELQEAKRLLRWEREDKYPDIMRLWYSQRSKHKFEPKQIEWPKLKHDPLWESFRAGIDPYHAFIMAMDKAGHAAAVARGEEDKWLEDERWRGKLGFLAPTYGVTPESLSRDLSTPTEVWSLERTQQALADLDATYPMIPALKKLVEKHLVTTGEIRSLWGRPRRINGYYHLARPNPLIVSFTRRRDAAGEPLVQYYEARCIPVGMWRQGVTAFVERIHNTESLQIVMQCNKETGAVEVLEEDDAFVSGVLGLRTGRPHFAQPPFANFNFASIESVEERETGLIHWLPRQAQGLRMLFNSIFQGSGSDHLRRLMNNVDREVCSCEEFRDCKLILTIHDALLYEVPETKWEAFVKVAMPVLTRRPSWATIDIAIEVEQGVRFGQMEKVCKRNSSDFNKPGSSDFEV